MKKFTDFVVGYSFIFFVIISFAFAQTAELPDRAKGLDSNSNGVIDPHEAQGPLQQQFNLIDSDNSGSLDGAEITSFFRGGRSGGKSRETTIADSGKMELPERARGLDKNANGLIDKSEAIGPLKEKFSLIDTDKNGGIDGAELSAFFGGNGTIVGIDPVFEEVLDQTIPVIGQLVAVQSGPISARISGPVRDVRVAIGDRVKKGQILVNLVEELLQSDSDRQLALVEQRHAMVDIAKAELTKLMLENSRIEGLRNSSAYSKKRADDIAQDILIKTGVLQDRRAQLAQAIEQLNRANINLKNARIIAPYKGVISDKHVEVGSFVNVGVPVVTIVNDSEIEIAAEVPTAQIPGLKVDSKVTVRLDDNSTHTAIIRAIIPIEDPLTRTRSVRFKPSFINTDKAVALNQSVTINVPIGRSKKVLTVHKDGVISRGGKFFVFVLNENRAEERTVKLGFSVRNRFVVLNGLRNRENVVVRGNEGLRNGQNVRVMKSGYK